MIEIFHYDHLRYTTGDYPEAHWLEQFILYGYARGIEYNNEIKAVLVAEPVLSGGVYLWLLAVRGEDIGKGYGQSLLTEFEREMKELNRSWIFLTSWNKSENFYRRNGFGSGDVKAIDMCKHLDK